MRWKVEISGITGDPDTLRAVLECAGYALEPGDSEEAPYLLHHPKYSDLTLAPTVREDAVSVRERLQQIAATGGPDIGVQIAYVRETRDDGSVMRYLYGAGGASAVVSARGTVRAGPPPDRSEDERARVAAETNAAADRRRQADIARAGAALADRDLLKLRVLLAKVEPSITELGHIVDLAENLCRPEIDQVCSRNERDRFRGSINNPEVMGLESRHVLAKGPAPRNAMSRAQVKEFALRVGRWCLERCGG